MTALEFATLLDYIRFNNGWGENMYKNQILRNRRRFKYVTSSFDTRDGHVWRIELLEDGSSSPHIFRVEDESDITKIYEFLNEEVY